MRKFKKSRRIAPTHLTIPILIMFMCASSLAAIAQQYCACGEIVNGTPCPVHLTFYQDHDHDGYGNPNVSQLDCDDLKIPPSGYSLNNTDCDDNDPTVYPGAVEICDGKDNNCDGQIDEGIAKTLFYRDADGDGYGDGNNSTMSCSQPSGYVTDNTDCNDGDAAIHPGAEEICGDGIDNNCDGLIDETCGPHCELQDYFEDKDGDGYGNPNVVISTSQCSSSWPPPSNYVDNNSDCDDNNSTINPSTLWYKDADNDGYSTGATLTQCLRPAGYKLASELISTSGDCNDNDPTINPGAVEIYGNGKDDNCNGTVDEKVGYPCQNATGFTTTNITATSATLNWTAIVNPVQWQLQYKSTAPGSKWIDLVVAGNLRSVKISPLKANQNYNWHIRAKCSRTWTSYSNSVSFKTPGGTVTEARVLPEENLTTDMQVRAAPNPTNTNFTIIVKGNSRNDEIKMFVVDMYGRMIEQRALPNEQTITLGDKYRPGVYIVKFIQGDQSKQLKLIKLPE
jgi:hypothetical protein